MTITTMREKNFKPMNFGDESDCPERALNDAIPSSALGKMMAEGILRYLAKAKPAECWPLLSPEQLPMRGSIKIKQREFTPRNKLSQQLLVNLSNEALNLLESIDVPEDRFHFLDGTLSSLAVQVSGI